MHSAQPTCSKYLHWGLKGAAPNGSTAGEAGLLSWRLLPPLLAPSVRRSGFDITKSSRLFIQVIPGMRSHDWGQRSKLGVLNPFQQPVSLSGWALNPPWCQELGSNPGLQG